jgi:mono/diheme cytochrome c family protein
MKEIVFMRPLMLMTLMASLLSAQTPNPNTAPRGSADNGKKLFVTYGCYQCHGYAAHGGAGGDSLRGGPRIAPKPIPFAAFSKYVRRPTDQMPPYTEKLASDQDLADIYAWLLTIPEPPPVSSIPQLKE